jgi:hypothetical protein
MEKDSRFDNIDTPKKIIREAYRIAFERKPDEYYYDITIDLFERLSKIRYLDEDWYEALCGISWLLEIMNHDTYDFRLLSVVLQKLDGYVKKEEGYVTIPCEFISVGELRRVLENHDDDQVIKIIGNKFEFQGIVLDGLITDEEKNLVIHTCKNDMAEGLK